MPVGLKKLERDHWLGEKGLKGRGPIRTQLSRERWEEEWEGRFWVNNKDLLKRLRETYYKF